MQFAFTLFTAHVFLLPFALSGLLANVLLTVTSDHVCRIWREGILSSTVQLAESVSASIDLNAGSGRLASELDLLANYSVYHLIDYIKRLRPILCTVQYISYVQYEYIYSSSETALLTRLASTMEISSVAPSATGDPAATSSAAQVKANALASAHAATALRRLAPGECAVSVLRSARKVDLLCLLLERCARSPSGGGGADVKIFAGAGAHVSDGAPSDGGGGRAFGRRAGADGLVHLPHFHILATINAKTGAHCARAHV